MQAEVENAIYYPIIKILVYTRSFQSSTSKQTSSECPTLQYVVSPMLTREPFIHLHSIYSVLGKALKATWKKKALMHVRLAVLIFSYLYLHF